MDLSLFQTLYAKFGAASPRTSFAVVFVVAGLAGCGVWWLIGQGYQRELAAQDKQTLLEQQVQSLTEKVDGNAANSAHRKEVREALGTFMRDGVELLRQCSIPEKQSSVSESANTWYSTVLSYLSRELDSSYVERFKVVSRSAVDVVGVPKDLRPTWLGLDGRIQRLNEFIAELR